MNRKKLFDCNGDYGCGNDIDGKYMDICERNKRPHKCICMCMFMKLLKIHEYSGNYIIPNSVHHFYSIFAACWAKTEYVLDPC